VKAIVRDRYGSPEVLALGDIEEPTAKGNAVRVRVRATSVNPADWHFMRGEPYLMRLQAGLRRPKDAVLGCDLAGEVEAVGEGVSTLAAGDEVFGSPFMRGFGGFAEQASVPEEVLAVKPANLSFAEAATVPMAGMTALQGLRDNGRVEPGQRVLIIGASGGVGTFAVQIAKSLGAEVTGVCSTRNVDLVRSLGADEVIDYTQQDVTRDDRRYDLVFQLAGAHSPSECRRLLTPEGTLILSSGESDGRLIGPLDRILKAAVLSPFVGQKLVSFTVQPNRGDLEFLRELIEAGKVRLAIDRTYPLNEVPDAVRYLEEGHARGKVVITV
jgi:NADPH:quinone reductase-like Zn-dependent oxidoreductase